MPLVYVPYHLDQYLPDLDLPLPPGSELTTVVESLPDGDVWGRLTHLYRAVAEIVARQAHADQVPVVLAGDCTTALGIVAGLQHAGRPPGIVWFDAHGDLQTLETTTSGYLGGLPLRLLLGYRPELIAEALGLAPVPEERTRLVGARDLDPPERDFLAAHPVGQSTVDDLTTAGLPAGPLLLHIDLDVLDAAALPGLRYPVPDGPGVPAVLAAARRVLATGRVVGVSLACTWHPGELDPTGRRADILAALTLA